MQKKIYTAILFISLSFYGCNWFKKQDEKKIKTDKEFKITVPVTTSPCVKSELIKYIKTSGTAKAIKTAIIQSQLQQTLLKKHFKENDFVSKNQVLFTLDDKEIKLKLDKAKLQLKRSKTEFEAWKNISKNPDISALKMQTGLTEAKIAIDELNIMLEKTKIKAPFSGKISDVNFDVGQKLNMGDVLAKIYKLDSIQIKAQVLESEISKVKANQNVIVKFSAINDKVFRGKLKSVSPFINTTTRTCDVIVEIKNNGELKAGMYAEVKIAYKKINNQLLIYKDAILKRDGKTLIFTAEKNLAKWQYVKLGQENDKFASIISGVKPGQDVIIDGNFSLSHDADIEVVKNISFETILNRF